MALVWGLLAVPIVTLYWRRMRLRREPVATSYLWREVLAEERARTAWRRWRHPVSLATQLTLLALLVAALAEPLAVGPQRIVLVLRNPPPASSSGAAPCRWDADETVSQVIASLRPCDKVAVISAGEPAMAYCTLTNERATLSQALASVPTDERTVCIEDALSLARRMLATEPGGRVLAIGMGFGGQPTSCEALLLDPNNERPEQAVAATLGSPPPEIWPFLAVLCAMLLVAEWCLYQRRWLT